MTITERLKKWLGREAPKAPTSDEIAQMIEQVPMWPVPGSSVRPMNISTVYRCVTLLADIVASLPLRYMKLKGDVYVEATESRLHYLLRVQPCDYMSSVDMLRQLVWDVYLQGNAYIVPIYGRHEDKIELDRLALVRPNCVTHDTIHDTYTVNDLQAGVSGTYREDEIIHIKNYTLDGKTGVSTLTYARTVLSIARTGDSETLNRFSNGGTVRGIVSNDTSVRGFGEYQDKELDRMADDLNRRLNVQGRNITAIHGSAKFDQTSMNSADMQFLESRKFTVREICRFFGVHPSFVFDDTSNNYKSAEMANVAFLANTLNPLLRRIETELNRKLVAPTLCCKRKFEFDRSGVYALDLDSKVKYYTQMIAAGAMSVNDVRRLENMPAVEHGERVFVSANLKGIDETAQGMTNDE